MDIEPSPRQRIPQSERRHSSMTLILDHAEAEFADRGYDGTTVVGIAERAGVDAPLVRYYFGEKRQLFGTVVRRRAPPSNALRRQRMAEYRAATGEAITVEGIIDAFIRPSFELANDDDGWRNYCKIMSFVNSTSAFHGLMAECFDDVSQELIADLRRALPHAREQDLYWAYHFLTGSYTFSLGQTGRIDTLSHGLTSSGDFASIGKRLPIVLGAGIRAMCAAGAGNDARAFQPLPPGAIAPLP